MNDDHCGTEIRSWLAEPMSKEVKDSIARLAGVEDVRRIAVMPDVHLAAEVCVGLVVATTRMLLPCAVGADIGCGMAAIAFDANGSLIDDERLAGRLLADLYGRVPALKQGREAAPGPIPDSLLSAPLSHPRLERLKARDARWQLGTLGRGNHFLELQRDVEDRLWLMLHSGSRAMGQAIAAHHLEAASAGSRGAKLIGIDAESAAGQAYLNDLNWAIEFANANRLAMLAAVREILKDRCDVAAIPQTLIHCHHNHVRRELHAGEWLWVHRKGALSAADGELGVIPGSMGTRSFHVCGRGEPDSLCSSSHGAGRALRRGEAATTISVGDMMRQMRGVWFDHRRARQLRDEAPAAYKDIGAVMRAQRTLTRIERELQPLLSYKG